MIFGTPLLARGYLRSSKRKHADTSRSGLKFSTSGRKPLQNLFRAVTHVTIPTIEDYHDILDPAHCQRSPLRHFRLRLPLRLDLPARMPFPSSFRSTALSSRHSSRNSTRITPPTPLMASPYSSSSSGHWATFSICSARYGPVSFPL